MLADPVIDFWHVSPKYFEHKLVCAASFIYQFYLPILFTNFIYQFYLPIFLKEDTKVLFLLFIPSQWKDGSFIWVAGNLPRNYQMKWERKSNGKLNVIINSSSKVTISILILNIVQYTAQQRRYPSLAEQQASDSDRGWKHLP